MSERRDRANRSHEPRHPDRVRAAVEADPSEGKVYAAWILRQVRAGLVTLPADGPAVRSLLEDRERVKGRPAFDGRRDIYAHDRRGLEALVRWADAPSARQRLIRVKREGAAEVYRGGDYRILRLVTPAAAAAYSRGTRWCTADRGSAAAYLAEGPLYLVLRAGRRYALAHPASAELRDEANRQIRPDAGLEAALAAAGPDGFLYAARRAVRRHYRRADFAAFAAMLRNFDDTNLLAVPLAYLSDDWFDCVWRVFRASRAGWVGLKAARPQGAGPDRDEWWAVMAFLRELRWERAERAEQIAA